MDAGGALLTQLPLGINRRKQNLIERTRIQSGMSDAVVPVEMASKSGTMHTVRFCKSQGRKLILVKPTGEQQNLPH